MTELHWAADCGDPEGVRSTLDQGCEVNAFDEQGWVPLHWLADLAATGGDRLGVLDLLVKHGADVNIKSSKGVTALHLARQAGTDAGEELAQALTRLGAIE